jgi:hypothetical protein
MTAEFQNRKSSASRRWQVSLSSLAVALTLMCGVLGSIRPLQRMHHRLRIDREVRAGMQEALQLGLESPHDARQDLLLLSENVQRTPLMGAASKARYLKDLATRLAIIDRRIVTLDRARSEDTGCGIPIITTSKPSLASDTPRDRIDLTPR